MDSNVELLFLTDAPLPVKIHSGGVERSNLDAAIARLGDLGADFRPIVEEEIYQFYLQEIEDGSANFAAAQDQLDWEAEHSNGFPDARAATRSAEVWPLVRFRRVMVEGKADGRIIVRVEGNAAWDGEHGIVLHFDQDAQLLRVSGYGVFL